MARKGYYGVFGWNGLGVFTDYNRLMSFIPVSIFGAEFKRFSSFEDAYKYAVEGFMGRRSDIALSQIPKEDNVIFNFFFEYKWIC